MSRGFDSHTEWTLGVGACVYCSYPISLLLRKEPRESRTCYLLSSAHLGWAHIIREIYHVLSLRLPWPVAALTRTSRRVIDRSTAVVMLPGADPLCVQDVDFSWQLLEPSCLWNAWLLMKPYIKEQGLQFHRWLPSLWVMSYKGLEC